MTDSIDRSERPDLAEGADAEDPLEQPDAIRGVDDRRRDGRPTGSDEADLRPGTGVDDLPTIAPEEQGGTPTTEHGPGGDL